MNQITTNYIYLLHEREHIRTSENVYKVGMTRQSNLDRFNNYPKGSILLFQMECIDCKFIESIVLQIFKDRFYKCCFYGNEYFKGNKKSMIDIIYLIITNENEIQQCTKHRSKYIEDILKDNSIICNMNDIQQQFLSSLLQCGTPIASAPNTKFFCKKCDFYTNKISNYNEHLLTKKHKITTITIPSKCPNLEPPAVPDPEPSNTEEPDEPSITRKTYNCKTCNKPYFSKKGVWQHSKKCKPLPAPIPKPESSDKTTIEIMAATMMEMYKSNQSQMLQLFTRQFNKC